MSFSAEWLALRDPADMAARDAGLLARARDWLAAADDPLAVDLGAGTGATVRAIGPERAHWRLVDNDPALLAEARRLLGPAVATIEADIAAAESLPLSGARLVTASALLDLAGRGWMERLATAVASAGAGFYAALSYDGRMEWFPADAEDRTATEAFNRHQRRDKGLGHALGPDGAPALAEAMRARGYEVFLADSAWRLGAEQSALQQELLAGIAQAAAEAGFGAGAWLERRLALVERATCRIGHLDLLALPMGG